MYMAFILVNFGTLVLNIETKVWFHFKTENEISNVKYWFRQKQVIKNLFFIYQTRHFFVRSWNEITAVFCYEFYYLIAIVVSTIRYVISYGPTKGGKLRNVITHDFIWVNQKTESSVYHWLRAQAMFDVTPLPRICRDIGCHFKRSVDTLVNRLLFLG